MATTSTARDGGRTFQPGDRVLVTWQGTSERETGTVDRVNGVWVFVWLASKPRPFPCGSDELERLPVDLREACPYCGSDEPQADVEDRDDAVGYSVLVTRCAACWPGAPC